MHERDWTCGTPMEGDAIAADGLRVNCLPSGGATLVSGNLVAAVEALAPAAPMLGLLAEIPHDGPYWMRIARDRALLCTTAPLHVEGWQDGFATSAADDLFVAFAVRGDRAGQLRDALVSAAPGSPSAATLILGHRAIAAAEAGGCRLWVERPEAAAFWSLLGRYCQAL